MHFRSSLIALCLLAFGSGCVQGASRAGPERFDLLVLATTDVHGRLRGWDYHADAPDTLRGLSRVATVVDSLRQVAPGRVVVVDAGDLLQGNPLTFVSATDASIRPHPVIAAMNAVGYDAAVIGNHEFNYGLDVLARALDDARFPFLAANVHAANGTHPYPAWHLIQRGPVRVGIIGATTPGSMAWDRRHLEGRLVIGEIVAAVRQAEAAARGAGADITIAVLHAGLDGPATYDTVTTGYPGENVAARLAREVPGLSLIVYGHSHRELADTVIAGTRLIQPRFWATSVGVATLRLARGRGGWEVTGSSGELVPVAGRAEHAGVLDASANAHEAARRYVATPIGGTPEHWRADSIRVANTALLDFMLEVQRRAAGAELSVGAAYSLSAGLGPGPITISDMTRIYPYENTLRAIRISGRQLRDYLEFSSRFFGTWGTEEPVITPGVAGFNFDVVKGVDYVLDISRPVGSRVVSLARQGRLVADTDTFTMAINNYRQGGGGGYTMIADAPLVLESDEDLRQLLIDEVRRRRTLHPHEYEQPNWRIVPEAAMRRAYEWMHRTHRDGAPPAATPDSTRVRAGALP